MTTLLPPICYKCKHFRSKVSKTAMSCTAFPDGIPDLILYEGNKHRQPVAGDHGIQFELAAGESLNDGEGDLPAAPTQSR